MIRFSFGFGPISLYIKIGRKVFHGHLLVETKEEIKIHQNYLHQLICFISKDRFCLFIIETALALSARNKIKIFGGKVLFWNLNEEKSAKRKKKKRRTVERYEIKSSFSRTKTCLLWEGRFQGSVMLMIWIDCDILHLRHFRNFVAWLNAYVRMEINRYLWWRHQRTAPDMFPLLFLLNESWEWWSFAIHERFISWEFAWVKTFLMKI